MTTFKNFEELESQRAHSPLLAAGLASIKIKNTKLGSKITRSLLRGSSIMETGKRTGKHDLF
jgi:hypothetical protein